MLYPILFGLASPLLKAQQLQPLRIGDRVPDVLLPQLINHPTVSAKLRSFLGKPLIIDFWFIGCASCVELMPHMDSIQHEYKGKLNVLLAAPNKKEDVQDFFAKSPFVKGIKFTQAVNDKVLNKLFPAAVFPHQVWIDKNGIVKAITDGKTAKKENIEKFIAGKDFAFVPKTKDELDPFVSNTVQPLMLYNYEGSKQAILHYSYLSQFKPEFAGMVGAQVIDSTQRIFRFKAVNSHFSYLYDYAYSEGSENRQPRHMKTRIIREDDGSTLPLNADTKNHAQYYSYDLIDRYTGSRKNNNIPSIIHNNMVADLDRTFKLRSHVEKRMIKCWVLKEYGNSQKYRETIGNGLGYNANAKDLRPNQRLVIENIPPSFFITTLNHASAIPFICDINYQGKMSFEVTWLPDDIAAMSATLRTYGLDIALEEREREVIVLRNSN